MMVESRKIQVQKTQIEIGFTDSSLVNMIVNNPDGRLELVVSVALAEKLIEFFKEAIEGIRGIKTK